VLILRVETDVGDGFLGINGISAEIKSADVTASTSTFRDVSDDVEGVGSFDVASFLLFLSSTF